MEHVETTGVAVAHWFDLNMPGTQNIVFRRGEIASTAPVFIVGSGRCGTTLLRLILNRHHALAILGEPSPFSKSRRYGPLFHAPSLDRFCKDWTVTLLKSSPHPDMMQSAALRRKLATAACYAEAIDLAASHYAAIEGKTRWGYKAPEDVQRLKEIVTTFPNAKILHVTRDPRAVVHSFLVKEKRAFHSINLYYVAKYWAKCERLADRFEGFAPQKIKRIRYENLVERPEATVRDICSYIGVDFEDHMLEVSASAMEYAPKLPDGQLDPAHRELLKPINVSPMAKWKRDFSPPMIGLIEMAAGNWLTRRGYTEMLGSAPNMGALRLSVLELGWQIDKLRHFVQRFSLTVFWTVRVFFEHSLWRGLQRDGAEQTGGQRLKVRRW